MRPRSLCVTRGDSRVLGEPGHSDMGPSLQGWVLKTRFEIQNFLWLKFIGSSKSQTYFSFFLVERWERRPERLFFWILQCTISSGEKLAVPPTGG